MTKNTEEKAGSKGEQTRQEIIEAAFKLFLEHGYHGTSMRQIADGAGLALGGIYNHFASKEEIFAAVLEVYHPLKRVVPMLENAQGESVETFVKNAGNIIREATEGAEARIVPLALVELVEFQGRHLVSLIESVWPSMFGFVQKFGQLKGELRDVPRPVMLRMFIITMVGFVITEIVLRRVPLFRNMELNWFDGMVDIYLHGILAKD
jgi:AcrR family transcriptional regulator